MFIVFNLIGLKSLCLEEGCSFFEEYNTQYDI